MFFLTKLKGIYVHETSLTFMLLYRYNIYNMDMQVGEAPVQTLQVLCSLTVKKEGDSKDLLCS